MKIYFVCSPSLGILDNWLPIIYELKEKKINAEFVFVFPKPNAADKIDLNSTLIQVSINIFDSILIKSHSGLWIEKKSFNEVKKIALLSNFTKFCYRLINFSMRYNSLKFLGKTLRSIFSSVDYLKHTKNLWNINEIENTSGIVLYDVYEEQKNYNSDLIPLFNKFPKFSISHGINIDTDSIKNQYIDINRNPYDKVYLFSELEKEYYKESFFLKDEVLSVVGIPRHEEDWISKITNIESLNISETFFDSYAFIISRSISDYFTYERKKEAIVNIKKIVIDKLNIKVIVKCHPKETTEGLYESIFGMNDYGITWEYSNKHPFFLGSKSLFAISFFSGVSLDMIANETPTIEYLNLNDISKYDNKNALRDENDDVMFSYRYHGFVLGSSNCVDFEKNVYNVMNHQEEVLNDFKTNYLKKFSSSTGSIKKVSDDILSVMNKLKNDKDLIIE